VNDEHPPLETWETDHVHIGRRVLRYGHLTSTNAAAAMLAGDPAHHGTVILADEQSAGRGQYGRTWQAPPGTSVLMSVLLFPPPALRRPAVLTALAAVAVGDAVLRATGWQANVKWPNDVLLHGQKICGILIEQGRATVVGIGLNVSQTSAEFAAAGLPLAGSLAAGTGRPRQALEVARSLIRNLDRAYDLLAKGESATLEASWKLRLGLLGRYVVAEEFGGARHRGRLRDLTFAGIVLQRDDGECVNLVPESIRSLSEVEG
jgi:BirA family biotin operon repressor/biotin-[acetyl-CoA-carboxylase] ligase